MNDKISKYLKKLDLGEYQPYLISGGNGAWKYEKSVPLTNDGKLWIGFLGVGAAFSRSMFQSNMIVIKGDDCVFIDLGTKSTLRLAEFGLSVHDVKNIIITHSHADHIGSLEELALKRRYEAPFMFIKKHENEDMAQYTQRIIDARNSGIFRPNIYSIYDYANNKLFDWSLRAGLAFSEEVELFASSKGEMTFSHYFNLIKPAKEETIGDNNTWTYYIGNIKVTTFLVKHIPDSAKNNSDALYSIGLVIDDKVYISGDTKFDYNTTMTFGGSCELLFHDCQDYPGGVHANFEELKQFPSFIKEKMLLYHLSDGMLTKETNGEIQKAGFGGLTKPLPIIYEIPSSRKR